MTIAPSLSLVHAYEGADPYEIIPSKWGNLPRWHVNANLTGEMKDYERVRNDPIEAEAKLADIATREKALLAQHMELEANKRKFQDAVNKFMDSVVGPAAQMMDRLEQRRAGEVADQQEPLAVPPGAPDDPSDPSKEPEPALELEGDNVSGTSPGEPTEPEQKEDQDPHGEFLKLKAPVSMDQAEFPGPELPHPPEVQQPIAAGLDKE